MWAGPALRSESRGLSLAAQWPRRDDSNRWDVGTPSGHFGQLDSRHSRGEGRRSAHLVRRLDPGAQRAPDSVELLVLRACRPVSGQAQLSLLRSPLLTATGRVVAAASRRPAGLGRPAVRRAAGAPVQGSESQ